MNADSLQSALICGQKQVLIVGAGPTGLVLALSLARHGVKPRIIERNDGPGEASRAMAVHARTLEFYRQLGFADQVVRLGIKMNRIHLREGAREVARIDFGDFGGTVSPYPFVLSFPQDDHERLLVAELANAGVHVEWGTELVSFDDEGEHVRAMLRKGDTDETVELAYLCGCDGAGSTVRRGLGLEFEGGTYDQVFYVTDVEATGDAVDNDDLNACLGDDGFQIVFPIRSTGNHRLIGIVPEALEAVEPLTFDDVRPYIEKLIDIHVTKVHWFSRYMSHHRVADSFRFGRVFIAGDAGHIHSPAGGQGMNTGIGDAFNLGWKLAAALSGRADATILDTYEPERLAFARVLVKTTDQAFKLVAGDGIGSHVFRDLVPHVWPFLMGFDWVKTLLFRTVSQTRINYHESALSVGEAGDVKGGDRLPWAGGDGVDNFRPLESLDWQVHVYGEAPADDVGIPLHEFPWSKATEAAGLERDAMYLVRPDGYVAYAGTDVAAMRALVSRFGIRTGRE
ncbi:MAG TPA: FAD-dependent monooxygenase [Blastocatellia bacterium]|nr:FAD-dependent monooxygenase [Blastocatellia bacterium]